MKSSYIAIHQTTQEAIPFKSYNEKEFKRLNSSGYNIYEGINTFIGNKRTIDCIGEYKGIGIDFDIGVDNKYNSLKDLLSSISSKLGVLPTNINETYKGYHLLFELKEELSYLSNDSYISLFKNINRKVGGDIKMRDITGVLKIPGYIDVKNNRNYEIVTIYNNPMNKISLSYLEENNIKIEYRNKEKVIKKDIKTDRNFQDVENLDAKSVIEKINELYEKNHYLFKKEIKLVKNSDILYSIDGTDGLKLQLNLELNKWEICDYSKRTRSGIGKFIYNHYCKDILDSKIKGNIYRTIMREFGIKHQMGSDKISLPLNMALGFYKDEYIRKEEHTQFIKMKDEISNIEELISSLNDIILSNMLLLKLITAISIAGERNKENGREILVGETELLSVFGKVDASSNKNALRSSFIELSKLNYTIKDVKKFNGKNLEGDRMERIFDIGFWKNPEEKGKIYYSITYKVPFNEIMYLPKEIINLDGKLLESKRYSLAYHIKLNIQHHKVCIMKIEDFINFLELKSLNEKKNKDTITEVLKSFKDKNIIQGYEKSKKNIYKIW